MAKDKVDLAENSVAYFDHPDHVPDPGFYTLKGNSEEDENGVRHETQMVADKRVYPSPDGEGFLYDLPEPEGGDE